MVAIIYVMILYSCLRKNSPHWQPVIALHFCENIYNPCGSLEMSQPFLWAGAIVSRTEICVSKRIALDVLDVMCRPSSSHCVVSCRWIVGSNGGGDFPINRHFLGKTWREWKKCVVHDARRSFDSTYYAELCVNDLRDGLNIVRFDSIIRVWLSGSLVWFWV